MRLFVLQYSYSCISVLVDDINLGISMRMEKNYIRITELDGCTNINVLDTILYFGINLRRKARTSLVWLMNSVPCEIRSVRGFYQGLLRLLFFSTWNNHFELWFLPLFRSGYPPCALESISGPGPKEPEGWMPHCGQSL